MAIWTNKGQGWYALTAMQDDPDAIIRGGDVWVHPATLRTRTKPWKDGGSDVVEMVPDLVGPLAAPVPTEYGWTVTDMGTGTLWEITSLQPTKWHPYLDGFAAPGWKLLRWVESPAVSYNDDEWRPKKIFVTSNCPITYGLESPRPEDIPYQEPWVIGCVSFWHNSKVNNSPAGNYMTGQIHVMPLPLVTGWRPDGSYVGKAVGKWEKQPDGIEKVFDKWDIEGLISLGATRLCTDATLGYTTMGSNIAGGGWPGHSQALDPNPVASGFEARSLHVYVHDATGAGSMFMGLYKVTTGSPNNTPTALICYSENKNATDAAWNSFTVSPAVALPTDAAYWITAQCVNPVTFYMRYGSTASWNQYANGTSGTYVAYPPPATQNWGLASNGTIRLSAYMTYEAQPAAPSKATNPDPSNSGTITASSYTLAWTDGGGATSYDVWINGVKVSSSQAGTTYAATGLAGTVTWRIDSINGSGTTTGDTWTFTAPISPKLPIFAPAFSPEMLERLK